MSDAEGEVTRMLARWREGDPDVLENLIPLVYAQLHRIAQGYMRREREDHTLQPTALVNEVYMRLLNQRKISWHDRGHFYTFAARMMRNILKDHARAHLADQPGPDHQLVRERLRVCGRILLGGQQVVGEAGHGRWGSSTGGSRG